MITFEHGMSAQFMTFFLGEKTSEQLFLRNESDNEFIAFKIQCTASKKFRVRPTFGYMDPAHATIVTFQLSAQEKEEADCKFLIVVRDLKDSSRNPDDGIKDRWLLSETNGEAPVFQQTIKAEIRSRGFKQGLTLEDASRLVEILIRNSSRKPSNQLSLDDLEMLGKRKHQMGPLLWERYERYANCIKKVLKNSKEKKNEEELY